MLNIINSYYTFLGSNYDIFEHFFLVLDWRKSIIYNFHLNLFGLGEWPPLMVFAKYLKNGFADLHETL